MGQAEQQISSLIVSYEARLYVSARTSKFTYNVIMTQLTSMKGRQLFIS